jgi:vacuolar iron transporter family protein
MKTQKPLPPQSSSVATSNNQLNKLRAAVLGGNDGIVSTAGLVLGVAGASASKETILIAGVAGLVSGAISMAAGEFVSVSSQRDSEKAFLERMRTHVASKHHSSEADELIEKYKEKGISEATATKVAEELEAAGTITVELEKEFGIDADDLSNPWAAAVASALSFVAGSIIPLLAVFFSPDEWRLPITVLAVLLSLILTGTLSAMAGQANKTRAALRVVVWGIGAMAITYAIGHLIGISL